MVKRRGLRSKRKSRSSRGVFKEAPQQKMFWVKDGPAVRTLRELRAALKVMNDSQYDYHTKRAGNDFEKWVREVLQEKRCARELMRAKNRQEAAQILSSYL